MNVARLNFSHGTHADHGAVIERVRRLSAELDVPVAILQDLAGPKVRVGEFAGDGIELEAGADFTLTTRDVLGSQDEVSVSYPDLPGEVKPGDPLLLADGSIELEVVDVTQRDIRCRVVLGGPLSARKGVNCPTGLFGVPILDEKDIADLAFGVDHGVDYIGLSFVRNAEDVRTARRELDARGSDAPIIAKIETQAALDNIEAVMDEADCIMIARGDLSIETAYTRVPVIQKRLIAAARSRAMPAITATQMLFSMVDCPHPTRAEVADVANAIMDGSAAVMLSDETTVGRYPLEAVRTMAAIARDVDGAVTRAPSVEPPAWTGPEGAGPDAIDSLARAACELAASLEVDVIGTVTKSGETARHVARYRPAQPVLAATPSEQTYRRLALVRGVIPLLLPVASTEPDDLARAAREAVSERGWAGRTAVLVSDTQVRLAEL